MATKVHMEALSPTMEEGQLVRWLKAEGDSVSNGDILAEIETDKATMELVARGEGVLRKIFIAEGATAPVGEVIGVIGAADEDISGIAGPAGVVAAPAPLATPVQAEASSPDAAGDEATSPRASPVAEAESAPSAPPAATPGQPGSSEGVSSGGRVKASPLARRLAEEAALDLGSVPGSGPGGRIVMRDVEAVKTGGG